MANTTGSAKNMDKVKEMASDVKDKVQDTAHSMADKARDVASNVGHRLGEAASAVGRGADSAVSGAGRGMESFADTVRDHGPQSGVLGKATSAVADGLDSAGEYLESHGLRGIGEDLTNLIRRNPIPALMVGIGVGFLLARVTRS